MKRVFDVVLAGFALAVLFPWLLVLALAVRISSGPPVLFRHRRVGWRGRDFEVLKFRTMEVLPGSELGGFDVGQHKRVTAVGALLRYTKMDELPQLWNVLRGDMSLVGPRPEVRKWVEAYPERWRRVLEVRPGITDPASVRYRDEEFLLAQAVEPERVYREEILPTKLSLYEEYIESRTLGRDLRIMLDTALAILKPPHSRGS